MLCFCLYSISAPPTPLPPFSLSDLILFLTRGRRSEPDAPSRVLLVPKEIFLYIKSEFLRHSPQINELTELSNNTLGICLKFILRVVFLLYVVTLCRVLQILVSVLEIVSVKHLTCKGPGAHFTYEGAKASISGHELARYLGFRVRCRRGNSCCSELCHTGLVTGRRSENRARRAE